MLIRFPAALGVPRGQVLDEPVCLEDLMPTLLEAAGVPVPETVEGRSMLPLMRGEDPPWREHLHIECAPLHHTLTDGREKYIWFAADGREQFFRLTDDPTECHDLAERPGERERIAGWRQRMIEELKGREEGFTDGNALMPGQPYRISRPS
jgi:arylsulfatase A-like enzyme